MIYFSILLILVAVALATLVVMKERRLAEEKQECGRMECELKACEALGQGLADYNARLVQRRNEHKAKIIELLKERPNISNREVGNILEISRSSVIRYFDELEVDGLVQQVGLTGRGAHYTLLRK
jgi:predicted HTH transcriptional regulator